MDYCGFLMSTNAGVVECQRQKRRLIVRCFAGRNHAESDRFGEDTP
jgi:hypothetical protein